MRQHLFHIAIFTIAVLIFTNDAKSQRLNDITNAISQSLLQHGIDTILIYRPYDCPTAHRPTDSSIIEDISYVITKKSEILSIDRLTYEYKTGSGLILTSNFIYIKDTLGLFKFLNSNFNSIFSDTLLPGLFKYRINDKDTISSSLSSHPCYTELIAITNSGYFRNGIIDDNLHDGIFRNVDGTIKFRYESINYQHNISKSIYTIISILELLEKEVKNKFIY
jgi:hypothetical protein